MEMTRLLGERNGSGDDAPKKMTIAVHVARDSSRFSGFLQVPLGLHVRLLFLHMQVCRATATRDGLMKMKQVYEANPALGDPMSIQGQLTENGHKLDKLRAELKKYQVSLARVTLG